MRQKDVVHTWRRLKKKRSNKLKKRWLFVFCNQIEFVVVPETKYHCMEYQLLWMILNYICLKSSTIHSCLAHEEYQILFVFLIQNSNKNIYNFFLSSCSWTHIGKPQTSLICLPVGVALTVMYYLIEKSLGKENNWNINIWKPCVNLFWNEYFKKELELCAELVY